MADELNTKDPQLGDLTEVSPALTQKQLVQNKIDSTTSVRQSLNTVLAVAQQEMEKLEALAVDEIVGAAKNRVGFFIQNIVQHLGQL